MSHRIDGKSDLEMKKLSPFDFVKSINGPVEKANLFDGYDALEESLDPDSPSKAYVPFVINRSLSYFQDTVLIANEMNRHHALPPKMQYDFLCSMVRPRKRFSKWTKKSPDPIEISAIMEYYGYSAHRAREAYELLSPDQLQLLIKATDKGGK